MLSLPGLTYCVFYKPKFKYMKILALLLCTAFVTTGCGTSVKAVPARSRYVVKTEHHRHWHRRPGKTVVIIGSRVKKRPAGSVTIYYRNASYLYSDGVYYKPYGNLYEIIRPETGMIVPKLPSHGVTIITVRGETLYSYDNVLYKKVATPDGTGYEVQGFINK